MPCRMPRYIHARFLDKGCHLNKWLWTLERKLCNGLLSILISHILHIRIQKDILKILYPLVLITKDLTFFAYPGRAVLRSTVDLQKIIKSSVQDYRNRYDIIEYLSLYTLQLSSGYQDPKKHLILTASP